MISFYMKHHRRGNQSGREAEGQSLPPRPPSRTGRSWRGSS